MSTHGTSSIVKHKATDEGKEDSSPHQIMADLSKSKSVDSIAAILSNPPASNVEQPPKRPSLLRSSSSLQRVESERIVQNPIFRGRTFLAEFLTKDMEVVTAISESTIGEDANNVIAESIFVIFEASNKGKRLLTWAIARELAGQKSISTLFRVPSEAPKFMSVLYQKNGRRYIESVVGGLVRQAQGLDKNLAGGDKEHFVREIIPLLEGLVDRIINTIESMPTVLKKVLGHIGKEVDDQFPGTSSGDKMISYLFFSRYLNPAIVSPESCGLTTERPALTAQRALVLCSKVLQNLVTGMEFEDPRDEPLNRFIKQKEPRIKILLEQMREQVDIPDRLFHVTSAQNQSALINILQVMKDNKIRVHSLLTKPETKMSFLQMVDAGLFAPVITNEKKREKKNGKSLEERLERAETSIRKLTEQTSEQREVIDSQRRTIVEWMEVCKRLQAENESKKEEMSRIWEALRAKNNEM
ncbi:regulator of chromosome condensation domain-containing protein [Planoprotostelium fungivorum]|uniref:Regulator of chromosome condensation domain-containing protein n=1 Tax=Planoprotostelium fungivorum TaxID=1890364 RepID=A0A2P6N4C4_9EUKA|nr:regulator of chromosome condensation domain-containing protein [Planoprotostelium fungivorum]